jgi:hypothetical protein
MFVATSASSSAYNVPGTDAGTSCPGTDCGVIYDSGITERGIGAASDNQGTPLDSPSAFTTNFGAGPIVLMNGGLPLTQGRNGNMYQFVNYRLDIPALQPEGNYAVTITYTLIDATL